MIYASALRLVVLKFLLSMSASADVLALASLEVDLTKVEVGQTVTVWPTSILLRSTSSDASASTSADALIDSRNFSTTSRSALA